MSMDHTTPRSRYDQMETKLSNPVFLYWHTLSCVTRHREKTSINIGYFCLSLALLRFVLHKFDNEL